MTYFLKIITEYCEQYVDDIRLEELKQLNPPLYARRMYQYFRAAIPLFSLPPEMQGYLVGTKDNPKMKESLYDNTLYTVETTQDEDFTIELGTAYKDYDIVSCQLREQSNSGDVLLTPLKLNYDKATGDVTIFVPQGKPIKENSVLDFDFYTDGYFDEDLSMEIMNILGMCFQVVWQDRFNTDWLSLVSKVEDKSFSEQNRANKENADTERLNMLRRKLSETMRRYTQNKYYSQVVPNSQKIFI